MSISNPPIQSRTNASPNSVAPFKLSQAADQAYGDWLAPRASDDNLRR